MALEWVGFGERRSAARVGKQVLAVRSSGHEPSHTFREREAGAVQAEIRRTLCSRASQSLEMHHPESPSARRVYAPGAGICRLTTRDS
jgi:hypothetical protein